MAYIPNALPKIWSTVAAAYSATSAYAVDDYCRYDGAMYKCTTAIAAPGEAWNAAHWTEVTIASQLGGSGSISWAPVAEDYSSSETYDEGDFAIQEGKLYKEINPDGTTGDFVAADWAETNIVNNLGGDFHPEILNLAKAVAKMLFGSDASVVVTQDASGTYDYDFKE